MINTEELQGELRICRQDLKDANKAKSLLKKGAAKAKFYKEESIEAEHDARVFKALYNAEKYGIKISNKVEKVRLNEDLMRKIDKIFNGIFKDESGNTLSPDKAIEHNVNSLCNDNKANDRALIHMRALEHNYKLSNYCNKVASATESSSTDAVVVEPSGDTLAEADHNAA